MPRQAWAKTKAIRWNFIQPGCPAHNAYVDCFNGTYRLEVLDVNQFCTLDEVLRVKVDWLVIYNEQRTLSAIDHMPPLTFKHRWQRHDFQEKTGSG